MGDQLSTWDLSDLYSGPDDPRLGEDRAASLEAAATFAATWRGRIATADGPALASALAAFEALMGRAFRPRHFASLRYSVATEDPSIQAELAAAQVFSAEIDQLLAFWGVAISALSSEHLAGLEGAEALKPWAHYLEYQQTFAAHTLSEDAERTTARKDVTGKSAWVNLYTQVTSALQFDVEVDDQTRTMSRGEVDALGVHPDRAVRDRARDAIVSGFAPHRDVLTFVFNTLFEDHRLDMAARDYGDVIDFSVLQDDLDRSVVDSLITTTSANFDIIHRYHRLRRDHLGLSDYGTEDLRIPVFGSEPKFEWDEALELVLAAYERFSPRAAEIARRFVDGRWIDVFPRKGKSSGAFCSPGYPPTHPWVMLNYTGTTDDVFTLAHELGHGLHGILSLEQTPLNYFSGRALAETASVFAELWLHDQLMERAAGDPLAQRQLLDRQVRDAAQTAFHQVAYVNWERRAHAERATGTVPADRYGELWREEMERLYGDAVLLKERDDHRWVTIPHFVFARFYCYSYAFGKLLTLALHSLWRERGEPFVADYLALLASGGFESPEALLAGLDLDLADPAFWQRGCGAVRSYLEQLEALTAGP